eukprot:g1400.t1
MMTMPSFEIVIHGGAWSIPDEDVKRSMEGCAKAAAAGHDVLKQGGSAVDAVEAAVRVLENDSVFDAGTGSVLNEDGDVEMDAMIMNGKDLNAGSVIGVSRIKNPISLARVIMEKTEHAMFSRDGAHRIAKQFDIPLLESSKSLVTAAAIEEWKRFKKYNRTVGELFCSKHELCHDTVGACVMVGGRFASATSTGGITAKRAGRVGDSPIVGSGGYADDDLGAISCTGHGESILRFGLALRTLHSMEIQKSDSPDTVASETLKEMKRRLGGHGGLICIRKDGRVGLAHTTKRMAWARVGTSTKGQVMSGIRL